MEEQQTPVYVWGFGSHISESALFDFFGSGPTTTLASVTLHRDAMNNSLRRATLMYGDIDEAKAVSRALSGLPLGLGEIHMSLECFPEEACFVFFFLYPLPLLLCLYLTTSSLFSQEIPPRVEEEQTPVYVWGFGSHISESALFDLFDKERKTSLASVTLHRDAMNNSLRRATLIYNSKVEAEVVSVVWNLQSLDVGKIHTSLKSFPDESIPARVVSNQMMTTMTPFGLQASVPLQSYPTYQLFPVPLPRRVWVENRREQIREGMDRKSICYVSNFLYELEEASLRDIFQHCGEVQFCKIRRDPFTGRSRGDGFVEFVTPEAASEAIKLDGTFHHGRTIYVSYAKSKKVST
ncbi:PREDICTED: polyadenylate-binding protein, cytoplasmic and nuclear-like isoform X1 [Camelina sativa]|uniref:Polyadenylate-binding protein, cytoplasmic and nuclear-like isoform X1 n=1 Tax=Camelina sativa TaxID=90675 RepID=A0ABM0XSY4_CAMSA|nr:PREDICTED: polyadenylate-binding protein, cytoplasmic and nuclear-like isoform X1 [Camelina sativa]